MDIFKYRLLQGIAKGRIEVRFETDWLQHTPHSVRKVLIFNEGRIVAEARGYSEWPRSISVCGKVVKVKELKHLKDVMEMLEQRKADRIALNKLMSYLSGSSEDSLTNK